MSLNSELIKATETGDRLRIELLVSQGASINTEDCKTTPLHKAAKNGDVATVALLLSLGATTHARDLENFTPLHLALHCQSRTVIPLLLKHGAYAYHHCQDSFLIHYFNNLSIYSEEDLSLYTTLLLAGVNSPREAQVIGRLAITEATRTALSVSNNSMQLQLLNTIRTTLPTSRDQVWHMVQTILTANIHFTHGQIFLKGLKIKDRIEKVFTDWLAPLQLSKETSQAATPYILRALPRLLNWIGKVKAMEVNFKEKWKVSNQFSFTQGHQKLLQAILFISEENSKKETRQHKMLLNKLGEASKKIAFSYSKRMRNKQKILKTLYTNSLPLELLLLIREKLIHETLVVTLKACYPEIPHKIANYLVAEITTDYDACSLFYTKLFQHDWSEPFAFPMTPLMKKFAGTSLSYN